MAKYHAEMVGIGFTTKKIWFIKCLGTTISSDFPTILEAVPPKAIPSGYVKITIEAMAQSKFRDFSHNYITVYLRVDGWTMSRRSAHEKLVGLWNQFGYPPV